MGVKGLWELLHPVARPIKLENLSNKHLAIDASIWLHQFLRGMRDKEGQVIGNAHIIGFFRRICKLLYYNVKPIFVFDGGTPALKRLTIQERRKRKKQDANMVKRTAEKLFAAQLRLHALEQRKAARKKTLDQKQSQSDEAVHDSAENPNYLLDMESGDQERLRSVAVTAVTPLTPISDVTTGSIAKRNKDRYVLPPMEVDFDTLSKIRSYDERFGYQAEDDVSEFLNDFKKEGGVANIDSDVFKALPSEMQYEILHDIRLRSRVTSYERVQEMVRLSDTPMDFSKLQVQGVIRRNIVTHKLLSVNQAVSKMDEVVRPGRIASQRGRQYILIKNEEGGWVLGGKKPTAGATADKPVQLDSDDEEKVDGEVKEEGEGEEGWGSDDDDDIELEEVEVPLPASDATVVQGRYQQSSVEVKRTHGGSVTPLPGVITDDNTALINHLEAYVDEDESIEKVMAKFAEIEDEAAKKRSTMELPLRFADRMDDRDRTNEKNGLHLVDRQDVIEVQEGARLHLAKAGLRPRSDAQWPKTVSEAEDISSVDTLNSLDTLYAISTVDLDDLEGMVEDELTGEILSQADYDRRYYERNTAHDSSGRALSTAEESGLDQEAFHNYWTGYTPDCFKVKHDDYEWMIRDAIHDWDEDRIETEIHSATRKLEKSNVNDTVGVEALEFWKSFLESLLNRRLAQHISLSQDDASSEDRSVLTRHIPQVHQGSAAERRGRLSQFVLLDDSEEEDDCNAGIDEAGMDGMLTPSRPIEVTVLKRSGSPPVGGAIALQELSNTSSVPAATVTFKEGTLLVERQPSFEKRNGTHQHVPAAILKSPETSLSIKVLPEAGNSALPNNPILNFGSSILKRRASSTLPEQSGSEEPPEPIDDILSVPHEKTITEKAVSDSAEDLDFDAGLSLNTKEGASLAYVTGPDITGKVELESEKEELVSAYGLGQRLAEDYALDDARVMRNELEGGEDEDEVDEDEVDEDEDEDEAHEADLENEEQDFTKLFPDMASLPGVVNLKGSPPPMAVAERPSKPALSVEERGMLDQQEAMKMFDESRQLESEIKVLKDQHRKHQRDADDLTESMIAETQTLLRLFGIPYLVAPMEAEAQCADLQLRGVVDGILTEDSDVFLFGGARIFKNMFKEEKYVECYLMSDIERDLGVGRDRLVALAYLLGSDYTTGIKGVGLITAMEIIRLFPKLENFARWWRGEQHKVDNAVDAVINAGETGLTEMELNSIDEVALEKLAKQCKKIHVPSSFPDPHIADAYIRPLVDDDPAKFQWGIPDLDGLRDFLRRSLDWDRGEVDRVLLPIIRQMSSAQHHAQTTLDSFFDTSVGMGSFQPPVRKILHKSARLRRVVNGLTGQSSETASEVKKSPKTMTMKASVERKNVTKRSREDGDDDVTANQTGQARDKEDEDDEDDEGFVDELERKKLKTSRAGGMKKARSVQIKVPEAVIAAKRQLQSKNVELKLAARKRSRTTASISTDAIMGGGDLIVLHERATAKGDSGASSSSSSGEDKSDSEDDQINFTPSHWDLLAEKQQHRLELDQSPKKRGRGGASTGGSSGKASSLTALVSASNAARYGSSFRNKDTDSSRGLKKVATQELKKSRPSE